MRRPSGREQNGQWQQRKYQGKTFFESVRRGHGLISFRRCGGHLTRTNRACQTPETYADGPTDFERANLSCVHFYVNELNKRHSGSLRSCELMRMEHRTDIGEPG